MRVRSLKQRKQVVKGRRPNPKKPLVTSGELYYYFTFLIGLSLSVFSIQVYRNTIIRSIIPLCIILFFGIIAHLLSRGHYKRTYPFQSYWGLFIYSICSWGALAGYLFLAGNYYLANKTTARYNFEIKERSSLPGTPNLSKRTPTVMIDYFGVEKELIFGNNSTKKLRTSNAVTLDVSKGAFGFDIIRSQNVYTDK